MTKTSPPKPKTADRQAGAGPAGNMLSLERAIALLNVVAQSDSGLRLKEAAHDVGLSTSTAHRILSALVEHRMLRVMDVDGSRVYAPGSVLYRLGLDAARHYSVVDLARPSMRRLAELTQDTVFFSARDRDEAVCLDRVVGDYPIKTLTLSVGDRRPLGVGAGSLALLAVLPEAERDAIVRNDHLREQRYPEFTPEALAKWVNAANRLGYAHNPERVIPGMSAVAVAIRDAGGAPLGAISIAAVRSRMQGERLLEIVSLLKEECAKVAERAEAFNNPKGIS
jgi:DNA-binding IclR family transcriptional regulator